MKYFVEKLLVIFFIQSFFISSYLKAVEEEETLCSSEKASYGGVKIKLPFHRSLSTYYSPKFVKEKFSIVPPTVLESFPFSIEETQRYLTQFIIGEGKAVENLSLSVNQHYQNLRLNQFYEDHFNFIPLKKPTILIVGPCRCGKKASINKIAEFLDVSLFVVKAETLQRTENIEDFIVNELMKACAYNKKSAEQGIVYLDQIDQLIISEVDEQQYLVARTLQNKLIQLMQGQEVCIKQQLGDKEILHKVNTRNILFVGGLSFQDSFDTIGNTQQIFEQIEIKSKSAILDYFSQTIYFEGITRTKLHQILNYSKNSPIKEAQDLMKLGYDIDIFFDENTFDLIVEKALQFTNSLLVLMRYRRHFFDGWGVFGKSKFF